MNDVEIGGRLPVCPLTDVALCRSEVIRMDQPSFRCACRRLLSSLCDYDWILVSAWI